MAKSGLKILSIDDHKDNLISLRALIREAFPAAISLMAENGPAGIELALSEDPDVILLDVVMPGMDGFEVCQRLKSNPSTCDIPVVFITALKGDKSSRIRALEVGAEAFLAKPIDEIELTAQIRAMVKIKAANNQKRQEKDYLSEKLAEQTRELNQAHTTTLLLLEDLRNENDARKQNEVDLQKAKKFLEEAQRISHLGNWEWDLTTNQSTWSSELYRIYGRSQEMGTPSIDHWLENIHPDDRISLQNAIQSAMIGGNYQIDYRILRYDNAQIRWIHAEGEVAFEGGKPVMLHGVAQDISERKQAEEARHLTEQSYRLLYESAGVGIAYYSPDGIVFSYNTIAASHMGGKPEDFIGKSIFDLFPKAAADDYMDRIRKAAASESIQEYEDRVDLPGELKWFVSAFGRILDASNQVSGVQIISTEISHLKQAEEALRENQMMLTNILDSVPQTIFWKDRAGMYLGCNENFARAVGLAGPDQIIGKTDYDLPWSRAAADAYRADDQEVIRKNQSQRHIIEQGRKEDGTPIWVDTTKTPLVDASGKPYGMLGVYDDITERKQAEQKINEQLTELRRWYSAMLGREERTMELKKEVNDVLAQAGRPPRYAE